MICLYVYDYLLEFLNIIFMEIGNPWYSDSIDIDFFFQSHI